MHSIFGAAFETANNQIIQWRGAFAANRPALKFFFGDAIFCSAIKTADYYVFRHIRQTLISMILVFFGGTKQIIQQL
jgi:hypothetical protein